jgi:hypothetical protein
MAVRSPGYGRPGSAGATGSAGPQGPAGAKGDTGAAGASGATGAQGPKGDTGATGAQGAKGDAGTPGNTLLGTITIAESSLITLTAGVRRVTIATPGAWGVTTAQNLVVFPTAALPAGYAVHEVIATAANTIQIDLTVPVLSIAGSYSISARLVRVNT